MKNLPVFCSTRYVLEFSLTSLKSCVKWMGFCAAVTTLCVRKASDLHTGLLLIYAAWTERLGWAGLWWAGYQWGRLGNIGMPGARVEGSGRSGSLPHLQITHMLNHVIYFVFFFLCGKCTDILLFGNKFVVFLTLFFNN